MAPKGILAAAKAQAAEWKPKAVQAEKAQASWRAKAGAAKRRGRKETEAAVAAAKAAARDPIVDPSCTPKAKKALPSKLLKNTPPKAKKPDTGKAAMERKSVESSLNPLASQLPFHNFADDLERQNFHSAVAALAPDQVLRCRTTTIAITPLPTRQQRRH